MLAPGCHAGPASADSHRILGQSPAIVSQSDIPGCLWNEIKKIFTIPTSIFQTSQMLDFWALNYNTVIMSFGGHRDTIDCSTVCSYRTSSVS